MEIKELVTNVEVAFMNRAVKASKYPFATDYEKCTDEVTETQNKLAKAPKGSGHDNFLKGIAVSFDLTYTVKAWTEAERYHFFDIVSSMSSMHKLTKLDYDKCFIGYVTQNTKDEMQRLREVYDNDPTEENYLTLLYNCPTGLKLTAGIVTNYQQLKTIYAQRRTHKLPEWRIFCKWIESLPHSEWITG